MPNNNILKEIKNELISKGDEPRVDNLEQYISQNKIFTILFFRNFYFFPQKISINKKKPHSKNPFIYYNEAIQNKVYF